MDDDTLSAAGLVRSSQAAARAKKKVDDDTLLAAGSPRIRYAYAIQQAIRDMGHVCELIFTGRRDVIQMI